MSLRSESSFSRSKSTGGAISSAWLKCVARFAMKASSADKIALVRVVPPISKITVPPDTLPIYTEWSPCCSSFFSSISIALLSKSRFFKKNLELWCCFQLFIHPFAIFFIFIVTIIVEVPIISVEFAEQIKRYMGNRETLWMLD